jgi:hypothetical protein
MNAIEFLRQYRLGGYAIFDFVVAFVGIYLIAPWLSKIFLKIGIDIPKLNWLFLTLPIGIITHLLIGKMTPLTAAFVDIHGHYILKIVIIGLLILGLKGIRMI